MVPLPALPWLNSCEVQVIRPLPADGGPTWAHSAKSALRRKEGIQTASKAALIDALIGGLNQRRANRISNFIERIVVRFAGGQVASSRRFQVEPPVAFQRRKAPSAQAVTAATLGVETRSG